MSRLRTFLLNSFLAGFVLSACLTTAWCKTVYVKTTGSDSSDGLTWTTAKKTITTGIKAAVSGDDVWVATGTYTERITLASGVGLYGGSAGSESNRTDRNWTVNVTVIDGSAGGTVVTASGSLSSSTIIDGFTIRNGNATYYGGGISISSSITVSHDKITGNTAGSRGGGIYCFGGSPKILDNVISLNRSSEGSGVYADCTGTIANNVIRANTSTGAGGAISSPNNLSVINNTIIGNDGGGVYCWSSYGATQLLANNIIAYNSNGINTYYTTPTLRNNCVYNPRGGNYSGNTGLLAGPGDISVDPKLVSWQYGEAHLNADSPCIDAGYDSAIGSGWTDLDGQARKQGTHVDIGADEYSGTVPVPYIASVIRVSPSGTDANDGSSWGAAKKAVQAGIDAAAAHGGEVWVAAGTYSERVNLRADVHVYGGFAGTEASRSDRNYKSNRSILDGGGAGSVVTASNLTGYLSSTLDGFVIRNGRGTTWGRRRNALQLQFSARLQ